MNDLFSYENETALRQTTVIASTGSLDLFFDDSDFNNKIEKFKNREAKAKEIFTIKEVEKTKSSGAWLCTKSNWTMYTKGSRSMKRKC